ncbi:Aste57867_7097 [Aphanomyces stellatus]|nr:hypothetical protein As57867_007074 [Aphanomyces stellatus]VFT84033.1 Aste57867_7097 [Aphanomyces stellatus]
MVACTAAADMTGGYLIQRFVSNLRSNQSFVRGDYCAGSLSPGCDSFGRLSSDPRANCDFPVYKTNYFNAFLEAPSICPSDADNTLEVALSTASEKVLGVDDGRKAVTLPRANDDSSPTFVFDFINHDFQSRQTDDCLTLDDARQVVSVPCDPSDVRQKWIVAQSNYTIQHAQTKLCVEVDLFDPTGNVHVAACDDPYVNLGQYLSTTAPFGQCAPYAYDTDFDGDDLTTSEATYPSECCNVCQLNVDCKAFSWLDGMCYLKRNAGNAVAKAGVVSGVRPPTA